MNKKLEEYLINIQWKPVYINGIETNYIISNTGILKNKTTNYVLKWTINEDGYLKTTIKVNGKSFKVSAHRLVAISFIPNPENKPEVNHKDGIKSNNFDYNLEWVTSKENTAHAIRMGLKWFNFGQKGENNLTSKYTEKQIRSACELLTNPMNRPITIEQITGVNRMTLYNIRMGNVWNEIASEYEFPDINYRIGENNVKNIYTESQIHEVCKLLESMKYIDELSTKLNMSLKDIQNITGVNTDTISKIRNRIEWKHISCFYEFPDIKCDGNNCIYTTQQIHQVCSMLEDPYIHLKDISAYTGVHKDTVWKIMHKKSWVHISSDYKIASRINKKSEMIIELYKQNISRPEITSIIQKEFNIANRRNANLQVGDIIRRFKV